MAEKHYSANGFNYTVRDNGTIIASGQVPKSGEKCGARVTPAGMEPGDHKGHVIAASHNGVNEQYNMTAQVGGLNQGAYRAAERAETNLAKDGYNVQTTKIASCSAPESKPNAYMINDTITSPDGTTQHVNLSFANLSKDEQNEMNEYINDNVDMTEGVPNPDPLRESMTSEEYSQLMEETDQYLPSIKDEFDMTDTIEMNFEDEFVAEAQVELDTESVGVDNGDLSCDIDGGAEVDDGLDV